jgi:hypothetical protein
MFSGALCALCGGLICKDLKPVPLLSTALIFQSDF